MFNNLKDNDEVLFNINQVAKILQIVPATIRNWEKSGLFSAKRKGNNYRVYSLDDIEVLKKIRMLSLDQRMGSLAIKNILMPGISRPPILSNIEQTDAPTRYSKKLLSSKWKESRDKLNLTLDEVASQVGISCSYLSKLENGQANISFDVLNKLANFYGESILYFFEKEDDDRRIIKHGCGEIAEIGLPGVRMESLISQQRHVLFPMYFTIEPGCGSIETHRHHGEEFIYVLNGELQVTLNYNEVFNLKRSDSMYFKSFDYHSWTNVSKKPCNLLWVHSPIEANV